METTRVSFSGKTLLLCLLAILVWVSAAFSRDIPNYHGYVNDYANMISPLTKASLERALQSFDLTDSTQVAILTIDSLEGDPLEDFSIRTVDKWKIGQKGKDNGVLLLAVKQDRKIRIEVGRGLEGVLTDLLAGRIVDQVMVPEFKAGRFDNGFTAGVNAIISATRGEFKGREKTPETRQGPEPSPLLAYLLFGAFIVAFLGNVSRLFGVLAGALLLPLLVLFALSSPVGLLLLLFLVPLGGIAGLLLPFILLGLFSRRGIYLGGGRGFGSSGSGSFGGFGGGGFGGGGASGNW